jgi:hypothetical protein
LRKECDRLVVVVHEESDQSKHACHRHLFDPGNKGDIQFIAASIVRDCAAAIEPMYFSKKLSTHLMPRPQPFLWVEVLIYLLLFSQSNDDDNTYQQSQSQTDN